MLNNICDQSVLGVIIEKLAARAIRFNRWESVLYRLAERPIRCTSRDLGKLKARNWLWCVQMADSNATRDQHKLRGTGVEQTSGSPNVQTKWIWVRSCILITLRRKQKESFSSNNSFSCDDCSNDCSPICLLGLSAWRLRRVWQVLEWTSSLIVLERASEAQTRLRKLGALRLPSKFDARN